MGTVISQTIGYSYSFSWNLNNLSCIINFNPINLYLGWKLGLTIIMLLMLYNVLHDFDFSPKMAKKIRMLQPLLT